MQRKQSQLPRYHKWIQSLIVVTFDVDEGQKISIVVPKISLTEKYEKQIAMLAFPDSNSYADYEGTFKYVFKLADNSFGFVCFKQKKDENNSRGYSQKSFVVLTKLPFICFFEKLSEFLVFKLFNNSDEEVAIELQKIMIQASKWPEPQPLTNYIVPVLDYQINIQIPNYIYDLSSQVFLKIQNYAHSKKSKNISLEQIVTKQTLLQCGRFQQVKLTEHFGSCIQNLWQIWQSIMVNKALLLMGDNPYRISQAVLGSISLMNPFQYGADFSPYVTVYDSNLNNLQQLTKNILMGATNPLFLKLFNNKKISIISLNIKHKIKKYLTPLRQLCVKWNGQEQRIANESSIRKYFYKLNRTIIGFIDQYLQLQSNVFNHQMQDLKFFNEKQFLKFIKKKDSYDMLEQVFDGKKYIISFLEQFVQSKNFSYYLKNKNIIREKC